MASSKGCRIEQQPGNAPTTTISIQASGRLMAMAAMPVPKAVSPAPTAPASKPPASQASISRLALAPSMVPNSREP